MFAPSSRAFMQDLVSRAPQLAVDLGCGPGYTTRLLVETTQCVRAIGLDNSEHFLTLARRNATEYSPSLKRSEIGNSLMAVLALLEMASRWPEFRPFSMILCTERMSFVRHDVTQVPFPIEQSDLISCRFLLTHLREPQSVIERWATQLCPQGLLLLEEVDWIQTEHALLRM